MQKLIAVFVAALFASSAWAVKIEVVKSVSGKEVVVAYHGIAKLMMNPEDNCSQNKVDIMPLSRMFVERKTGSFKAKFDNRNTTVYVDMRDFEDEEVNQMRRFVRKNITYAGVVQSCGSAATPELIDIDVRR